MTALRDHAQRADPTSRTGHPYTLGHMKEPGMNAGPSIRNTQATIAPGQRPTDRRSRIPSESIYDVKEQNKAGDGQKAPPKPHPPRGKPRTNDRTIRPQNRPGNRSYGSPAEFDQGAQAGAEPWRANAAPTGGQAPGIFMCRPCPVNAGSAPDGPCFVGCRPHPRGAMPPTPFRSGGLGPLAPRSGRGGGCTPARRSREPVLTGYGHYTIGH